MDSMIALKNVTKSFDGRTVIDALALRIDPGSCLCITGESGAGKTTLMRLIIRADDPNTGIVSVDGVDIRTLPPAILQLYRRRLGIIFQEPIVLDHLTVEENICLPLSLLGAPEALMKRNAQDLLKRLNLLSKATLYPKNLNHGERSLLSIARALITAPMVIIADEPFQHLNPSQYKDVLELFMNMHKKGATIVLFTQDAAAGHALHAQTLHLKDGKIAKQAEPEKKSHISHADAHRILEEESETILKHSDHMNDHLTDTSSSSHAPRSGKRIRITSIGSNS